MIALLIGQPGSGKGTQGQMLAEKFGLYYLSSGQMFRELSKTNPEIARTMNRGDLLSDELVMKSLNGYLEDKNIVDGVILDGTTRTIGQYKMLKDWLASHRKKIDLAIFLKISDAETIRRQSSRRTDKTTGKVYNLVTNPPGPEVDQANLEQRADDKPEVISERLKEYHEITQPLMSEFQKDGILKEVDGERPIPDIFEDLVKILEQRGLSAKN